jgi:hypothetical protein
MLWFGGFSRFAVFRRPTIHHPLSRIFSSVLVVRWMIPIVVARTPVASGTLTRLAPSEFCSNIAPFSTHFLVGEQDTIKARPATSAKFAPILLLGLRAKSREVFCNESAPTLTENKRLIAQHIGDSTFMLGGAPTVHVVLWECGPREGFAKFPHSNKHCLSGPTQITQAWRINCG